MDLLVKNILLYSYHRNKTFTDMKSQESLLALHHVLFMMEEEFSYSFGVSCDRLKFQCDYNKHLVKKLKRLFEHTQFKFDNDMNWITGAIYVYKKYFIQDYVGNGRIKIEILLT